ncbi:hypothetical protein HDK77DRAFT_456697 [Phyllosticta capitalensis]|uniref:C2H2-type domain-containing protein n=1 Tax=Phyllosticta capitalensis TaxID=121624 RepID=A0ABR1YPW0_9PEZI
MKSENDSIPCKSGSSSSIADRSFRSSPAASLTSRPAPYGQTPSIPPVVHTSTARQHMHRPHHSPNQQTPALPVAANSIPRQTPQPSFTPMNQLGNRHASIQTSSFPGNTHSPALPSSAAHTNQRTRPAKPFSCEFCGNSYTIMTSVRRHQKDKHADLLANRQSQG